MGLIFLYKFFYENFYENFTSSINTIRLNKGGDARFTTRLIFRLILAEHNTSINIDYAK